MLHACRKCMCFHVRANYQVPTALIFESGNERFKSASLASALVYIAIMAHPAYPRAGGTHQAARAETETDRQTDNLVERHTASS